MWKRPLTLWVERESAGLLKVTTPVPCVSVPVTLITRYRLTERHPSGALGLTLTLRRPSRKFVLQPSNE